MLLKKFIAYNNLWPKSMAYENSWAMKSNVWPMKICDWSLYNKLPWKKIVNSAVLYLGISDHSLVFMNHKSCYEWTGVHCVIKTRVFKDFNKNQFLHDLVQQPWDSVNAESNPGNMWKISKELLMEIIDKHAPLKSISDLNVEPEFYQYQYPLFKVVNVLM